MTDPYPMASRKQEFQECGLYDFHHTSLHRPVATFPDMVNHKNKFIREKCPMKDLWPENGWNLECVTSSPNSFSFFR